MSVNETSPSSTPPGPSGSGDSFEKIAIVGTAPSSRQSTPFPEPGCPFDPNDWHVRCIGMDPNKVTPGWHRWYEVHDPMWIIDKENNPDFTPDTIRHIRWLAEVSEKGADVRLMKPSQAIPKAGLIRRKEIIDTFGPEFMTSSIAWMMADAILDNPKVIGLWGVDMALTEEYAMQRAGCMFFIRECRIRGIQIVVPPQSDLFFGNPIYPDNCESPAYKKAMARRKEITFHLSQGQQMAKSGELKTAHSMGALEAHDWWTRTMVQKL